MPAWPRRTGLALALAVTVLAVAAVPAAADEHVAVDQDCPVIGPEDTWNTIRHVKENVTSYHPGDRPYHDDPPAPCRVEFEDRYTVESQSGDEPYLDATVRCGFDLARGWSPYPDGETIPTNSHLYCGNPYLAVHIGPVDHTHGGDG